MTPGTYRVILAVDGKEQLQEFTVEADPDRPESSFADEEWEEEEDEEATFRPELIVR